MSTDTRESEFEDALEMARALLGANEDANDLWEANEFVSHAIRLRPRDSEAWMLKAQVMSALEDDTSALAAIEMTLRRQRKRAEAHYWRAAILADVDRHDDALRSLDRAFQTLTPADDWLIEDLYYERASIYVATGRRQEAISTFESGLRRCPTSTLLKTGLEPLQREQRRSRLTVLEGGRSNGDD